MRRAPLARPIALLAGLLLLSGTGTGARAAAGETAIHSPLPVPARDIPEGSRRPAPPAESVQALAPALAGPSAFAPAFASDFAGLPDNNFAIPPDTHGAVGPNHLMVTLNTEVVVQDRAGNPVPGSRQALNVFWLGVDPLPGGTFDPRVLYDALDDRWITVACDQAGSPDSAIFVGVSVDSSPVPTATNWYRWRIDVDTDGQVWADYPTVGFNRRWIVVQVNMFNVSDNQFNRTHIYVFEKAQLYAGNLVYQLISDGTISGTQAPAAVYDPTLDDIYLLQMVNPDFSGLGYLQVFTVTGPDDAPVLVPGPYVTAPPWTGQYGGQVDSAPQLQTPGCGYCPSPPCLIQTNDSRIQNVVYRNGALWAVQTVHLPAGGSPTRSAIQWWQIDTSGIVLQRGLIDSGGPRHLAFPSIAVNWKDDVLVGYSSFEGSQWASASYSFRTAIDPPGTMQSERLFHQGEACYYKVFAGTRNRWGDYSATAVDPTDDTRLWTIQEYAAPPDPTTLNPEQRDRWGTWWSMLDPTPRILVDDVAAVEGDAGTSVFGFRVRLTDPAGNPLATSQTVTVGWSTADGSATAGEDYAGVTSDTLTFLPGETERTIGVTVYGDLKYEPDETFFVDLTTAANATIVDSQATGTILNDDPVPQISIGDVALAEGTGPPGTVTSFVFPVTLSNPSATSITVDWATIDGTAVAGAYGTGDFVGVTGATLTIPAGSPGGAVTVQVHADTVVELDEDFYVDLSGPGGATLLKPRGVGRISDDDAPYPGVIGLSVVADGTGPAAGQGRDRLQWLYPSTAATIQQFRIRWNESTTSCTSPDPNDPMGGTAPTITQLPGPGPTEVFPHTGLQPGTEYCYTVWLDYGGGNFSLPGATASARPFDATGNVKWKLFTGATVMAPPTVGLDAVLGTSNDTFVHAMQRGAGGGTWPGPWRPVSLGSVAQHRAPVVPTGGVSRAFISDQNGWVHAIDALDGTPLWSTHLPEGAAQGAPAGIFTDYGGTWSYVLVGTSSGSGNHFYALDPANGAIVDAFPGPADGSIGTLGEIYGTAAVDYASSRVYFASRRGVAGRSLWCLELGPPSDALRLGTTGWSRDLGADVDGSPVLRGGRVYVVDNGPVAWAIPADTGAGGYSLSLGDVALPGFLFPDRRNGDLYVATANEVHGLVDDGTALSDKWSPRSLSSPSVVLLEPGTSNLYVGVRSYSGDASLVRIDATTGVVASALPLETGAVGIGAPSLDAGFGMLHVGSEAGILYGVQLPF